MDTETAGWPYDAYRDDPLTALRIPVIGTPYPGWKYEVALLCPRTPGGQDLYPSLRPDDAEVRRIVAYIDWRMEYYNDGWKAGMRKHPLDTDATTNTVVLCKRAEGDWCYRRASWQYGPFMVPERDGEHLSLEHLLDRVNDFGDEPNPKWQAWKAAHPEAFGEAPPAGAGQQEET